MSKIIKVRLILCNQSRVLHFILIVSQVILRDRLEHVMFTFITTDN